ncbi:fibronectin type III domain-containing protein [Streptomyces cellulosae]
MARRSFTGLGRIYWVKSIADPKKPTAAEVKAGVELTRSVKRDGLKTPTSVNTIDISDASSLWNKSAPGTKGGDQITINGWRESLATEDKIWATLKDEEQGFLCVTRWGNAQDATTGIGSGEAVTPTVDPKEGDRFEVYTCTVSSRAMDDIGNDANAATFVLTQTDVPQFDAVIAGPKQRTLTTPSNVRTKTGTQPKATEFEVEYEEPDSDFTKFEVTAEKTGGGGKLTGAVGQSGKAKNAKFTGATANTDYDVTVIAKGNGGNIKDSKPGKTTSPIHTAAA